MKARFPELRSRGCCPRGRRPLRESHAGPRAAGGAVAQPSSPGRPLRAASASLAASCSPALLAGRVGGGGGGGVLCERARGGRQQGGSRCHRGGRATRAAGTAGSHLPALRGREQRPAAEARGRARGESGTQGAGWWPVVAASRSCARAGPPRFHSWLPGTCRERALRPHSPPPKLPGLGAALSPDAALCLLPPGWQSLGTVAELIPAGSLLCFPPHSQSVELTFANLGCIFIFL